MIKAVLSNNKCDFISEEHLLQLAEKVVTRYVISEVIPKREKEDVIMAIVERFLEKQEKIAAAYSGRAKVSTYCIAVLNRMCCEVIRKEMMQWKNRSEEYIKEDTSGVLSSSQKLLIEDEIGFLDKIIRQFHKETAKIPVFLAYYFKLEPNKQCVHAYSPLYKENGLLKLLDPKRIESKANLFENLAKVVNLSESKTVKADAVRMWLNKTMDKIIDRLNGPFQRANYDRETFNTLFEYYYLKKIS
jgi:hypothetical protein